MPESEITTKTKFKPTDYKSDTHPIWCPGCGDFGVLSSIHKALAGLNLALENVAVISGIGCSSRLPGYMATYGFNTVHGRILPIATGVKMANPEITVIGTGGDGDGFSIGMGHIPHAARKNVDLTYIVMDNEIYGLTKGQLSPTSELGEVTKTSAYGSVERPIRPVKIMLTVGATFIARAYSGNPKHTAEIIQKAIEHRGFAFIDVMSPCRTWMGLEQKDYLSEHMYYLEENENYDSADVNQAWKVATEPEDIALGVIYEEKIPTYDDRYRDLREQARSRKAADIEDILLQYVPADEKKGPSASISEE